MSIRYEIVLFLLFEGIEPLPVLLFFKMMNSNLGYAIVSVCLLYPTFLNVLQSILPLLQKINNRLKFLQNPNNHIYVQ